MNATLPGAWRLYERATVFVLAVLEGEDWLGEGEFLTVYLTFLSRLSPFWHETDGNRVTLYAGLPGTQVLRMAPLAPPAVAFLTLALAARAVVDGPAGGDMGRLKRLGGRFANPLLLTPGQAVSVTVRSGPGGIVSFEAADAAGSVVISNGYAEVAA